MAVVVGGAEIYRQFFPRCTFLYLSRIKRTTPGDFFLPPFEDQFALNQVIHENDDFRVERWLTGAARRQSRQKSGRLILSSFCVILKRSRRISLR